MKNQIAELIGMVLGISRENLYAVSVDALNLAGINAWIFKAREDDPDKLQTVVIFRNLDSNPDALQKAMAAVRAIASGTFDESMYDRGGTK